MASLAEIYSLALRNQQAGRLQEAEQLYRQILAANPSHADSLNQLGILAYQFGQMPAAADLFGRAAAAGRQPTFHYHHGLALQEMGRLDEAEAAYGRTLAIQANHPRAHNNLGNIHQSRGQSEQAVAAYRQSIRQQSNFAEAHYNLGMSLQALGRPDEAAASYRKALALKPDYAEGHNNLANILLEQGRLDEAIESYRQALAQDAQLPEAHLNLGGALQRQGRLEEAKTSFERALAIQPADYNPHYSMGNVLQEMGRAGEALPFYQRALAIKPDLAPGYSNLGNALALMGRLDEAVAAFEKAIALQPDLAPAHMNLGAVLQDQGKMEAAEASFRQALAVQPGDADAGSNLLINMTYRGAASPAALFAEHVAWGETQGARWPGKPAPHLNKKDPDKRLRVGFVSGDLKTHSVAFFLEPLLRARDRAAVEVFCYSEVMNPDATTMRLRGLSDHWRQAVGAGDAALAEQIRSDRIDVLVDLAGHTNRNRLPTFAAKPAPVQATWLGYPNTTGVAAIDYRIVDPITDPPGEADAFAVEKLVRLEDGFLCYAAPADAPEVAAAPFLVNGFTTFGSFNNPTKLSDETIRLWASLLVRVPDARLLLKGKPFADEAARNLALARFAANGIGADRLVLRSWLQGTGSHLATYAEVDIGLDPYPYNGTTTTCEALWMGVPVVTLSGDRHAARVGASLLARVGLSDLVATSPESYAEIAVRLAEDAARLSDLRQSLRPLMQASTLCDAPAFARRFETALRTMWRGWCEGRAPAAFEVPHAV